MRDMSRFMQAVIYFSVAFVVAFMAMSMLALGGINPEAMNAVVYTATQFWGCVFAVAMGLGLIGWCKRG
jgi:hypothetical protein